MEPFNEHSYLVSASRDCPHDIHLRLYKEMGFIYITQYPHSLCGLGGEGEEYNRACLCGVGCDGSCINCDSGLG